MGPRMEPLFLGGHPAVDFLNTAFAPDGQEIETIGDGRTYLDWFVSAGLAPEGNPAVAGFAAIAMMVASCGCSA